MSAWIVASITFICVFGSAYAAMKFRDKVPEHHLREESRDMVRLVTGLMATLSALVLGLLIASAKSSFDTINEGFKVSAAKIVLIDRTLAEYGPEAADARKLLRDAYAARIEQIFSRSGDAGKTVGALAQTPLVEAIERKIQGLAPNTEFQRMLQARALQLGYEIAQTRWNAFEEAGARTPPLLLVVLVFWLAAMFASFGLFAPRNRTTVTALVIGAFAVATAVFVIEEMADPLAGIIKISSTPMRNALAILGK